MTSSQTHFNQVLTGIAVEFKPPELSWDKIFMPKSVKKESDVWPVWGREMFQAPTDLRADSTESNETMSGWKYDNYVCEDHSLHDWVSDRQRENADSQLDLDGSAAKLVKKQVENNIELAVFGSGGILRTAANNGYSVNASWAVLTTASPRADITAAINAVEVNCGLPPNTIVLSREVGRHIMKTTEWKDEGRYTSDLRKEDLPATLFGLNAIYVGSLASTNKKGQSKTLTRVMGDDVWIGYVNPGGVGYREITYGGLLYTNEYANDIYNKDRMSTKIEYGRIYCLKKIAIECGGLLTSVLT